MTVIEDITRPRLDGTQRLVKFSNGYMASCLCHSHSYGGDEGQWEVAVMTIHDDEFAEDTGIETITGYLTEAQRDALIERIGALPDLT